MSIDDASQRQAARQLAVQAQEMAGKLKSGTWESVQALALASIAASLSVIAAHTASTGDSGDRSPG